MVTLSVSMDILQKRGNLVMMDSVLYFKNFPMGTEIQIAGSFVYLGLQEFNRLKSFYHEDEVFPVLYHIAIGIERLQKVLVVLTEEITVVNREKVEEELKKLGHRHVALHNRIRENISVQFTKDELKLLHLLNDFYKYCRYDRFKLDNSYAKERDLLVKFFNLSLDKNINMDAFWPTPNDYENKRFFGKLVGSVCRKYYRLIEEEARRQGIYTYEVRYDTPAAKVFLVDLGGDSFQKQYDNEQIALKELLIFCMNTREQSPYWDLLRGIEPLDMDVAGVLQEYLTEVLVGNVPQSLIDEVSTCYEMAEPEFIKERLDKLKLVGNPLCLHKFHG